MQVDPHYPLNYKDFLKKNPSATKSIFDEEWEELGPYYIEEVTGHYAVEYVWKDKFYIDDDPNIIYLGSRIVGFGKLLMVEKHGIKFILDFLKWS